MNTIKKIIKKSKKSDINDINWKKWEEVQKTNFRYFVQFIFYIADVTGPNSKVMNSLKDKISINKRSTIYAKTKYGYSASDLVKIVSEFFSLTAEQIIGSYYESIDDERCSSSYLDEDKNCYKKLIDSKIIRDSKIQGLFSLIEGSKNKTAKFVNDNYEDMYSIFITDLFYKALQNYPSTTGNIDNYCNYIEYSITGSTPSAKEYCSTINLEGKSTKFKELKEDIE